MSDAISWRFFLALSMFFLGAACGDTTPAGGGGNGGEMMVLPDAGDVEEPDAMVEPPEDVGVEDEEVVECEADTIIRCLVENTPGIEKCNFRGNGIIQTTCPTGQVCREAECVEVNCIPGDRICLEEDLPGICNDEGSDYEPQERCGSGATCSQGACLDPCTIAEESRSYIGCEYWPVELENSLLYDDDETSTPEAPFAVVLANPQDETARVTVFTPEGDVLDSVTEVYIPVGLVSPDFTSQTVYTQVVGPDGSTVGGPISGPLENVEVPPGGQLQVLFPRRTPAPYISEISKIAWKIVSDRPVVAYQFNPICCNYSFTNDASILLPRGALTENYMAMTYPTWTPRSNFSSPATLTVVAIDDDTEVKITFKDPRIREGENIPIPDEDGVINLTLQAQEVLNIETSDSTPEVDLTGTLVEANKSIVVFGGHSCTDIPFSLVACDHVEQQLFPMETWGRNYIAAPLKMRGEGPPQTREATYFKILAQKDGTIITLDRPYNDLAQLAQSAPPAAVPECREKLSRIDTIELNAGEFCEFGTNFGFGLNSNEPILVGAFMSGQASTGNREFGNQAGDPAFFLVPPQEQFRTEYDFLTPATYALDYVTVTAIAGTTVRLDGEIVDLMEFDPEIIVSQNVIRAHIPLDDGPHRMESDTPFGIIVYAYDDFVSYAFTGGLNLQKLNE
jgi:hypothetical protein